VVEPVLDGRACCLWAGGWGPGRSPPPQLTYERLLTVRGSHCGPPRQHPLAKHPAGRFLQPVYANNVFLTHVDQAGLSREIKDSSLKPRLWGAYPTSRPSLRFLARQGSGMPAYLCT